MFFGLGGIFYGTLCSSFPLPSHGIQTRNQMCGAPIAVAQLNEVLLAERVKGLEANLVCLNYSFDSSS